MDYAEANAILVDTDVYSYLMKPTDTRGRLYRPHVEGKLMAVSFVTVGELLFGAYKKKWGKDKIEELRERLRSVVIVPYDYLVCSTYADLKSKTTAVGISVADNDLWIAACAVRHSIPLVSNNRAHFEKIPGLVLRSESAVVAQIESQGTLKTGTATAGDPSSGHEPPASQ